MGERTVNKVLPKSQYLTDNKQINKNIIINQKTEQKKD